MAGLSRILEPGERIVLRLPTARHRWRTAILWGLGFPVLAIALRFLSGFPPTGDSDNWHNAGAYAAACLLSMLAGCWARRPHVAVTDRHILVRRGVFWRRHERMALRDIAGMDYDLKAGTLSLYGARRVLTVPCDALGKARVMLVLARRG